MYPRATPGASSTGEPTITSTAIIRSPVTHKSEMRSILTFNSKTPARGPGFQGEVHKRHLSMPPLKRALRPPAGPIIRQLMAEAEALVPAGAHGDNSAKRDQGF